MKGWYVGHWWVVVLVGLVAGFVGWSVGYIFWIIDSSHGPTSHGVCKVIKSGRNVQLEYRGVGRMVRLRVRTSVTAEAGAGSIPALPAKSCVHQGINEVAQW